MNPLRIVSDMVEDVAKEAKEWFMGSTKTFNEMKDKIKTKIETSKKLNFNDIENDIAELGREVMRSLCEEALQESLDNIDLPDTIEDSDSNIRIFDQNTKKKLNTIFGEISFERKNTRYRSKKGIVTHSVFPQENLLKLPKDSVSFALQKKIAYNAVNSTLDRLIPEIEKETGSKLSKGKVISILNESSADFDAFYEKKWDENLRQNLKDTDIIIATFDGKGIPMRRKKEDLNDKELNNKDLNNEGSILSKKSVLKSHSNKKKMATVAAVYNIKEYPRTAIDFHHTLLGELRKVDERPKPVEKKVWASLEKSAKEIIQEGFNEVDLRDPHKEKPLVILIDGAIYQKEQVINNCKECKRNYTIIIDIIHAVEYIWKASRVLFPNDTGYQKEWSRVKQLELLEGKVAYIAQEIEVKAEKDKLEGDKLKIANTSKNYFLNNQDFMRYNQFLKLGYPIGSGVIEGTCRSIIGDRLEITGAHWTMTGAEAMLKLRSLVLNGDFDEYWSFHVNEESKKRNSKDFSKRYIYRKLKDM